MGTMGMSMRERKALTDQVAARYRRATRKGKQQILDEFVANTGYHRKYAIRLLNAWGKKSTICIDGKVVTIKAGTKKRKSGGGRKKYYNDETIEALYRIWLFFGCRCGKILVSMLRNLMKYLVKYPVFGITGDIERQLLSISASTIDRRLRHKREGLKLLNRRSHTKRGPLLKSQIPVRVHWPHHDRKAGFFEADTVHHCAESAAGEYCLTLTVTDVGSGWVQMHALLNKAMRWILEGLGHIRSELPFPLQGIDSDSGSEFINRWVFEWAKQNDIHFTRGRSCHKNDNCYVEQKNDACVRQYVGYARFETQEECDALAQVYEVLCPLLNYFIPTIKLLSKERHGAKIKKVYEQPTKTPYQRLLTDASLSDEIKADLIAIYESLDPIELQLQVDQALDTLVPVHSQKLQARGRKRIL
jgi:hypothetical protein